MSADKDAGVAPIIIKRKKSGGGDGHHGGAWKVAYADFVTAMMAFFLLMWLLNATTEKQRKGIADYFTPTIAVSRVSGGGDGSLGGDTVFSEQVLPRVGRGATSMNPTEENAARGVLREGQDAAPVTDEADPAEEDKERGEEDAAFKVVEEALLGSGGESSVADELLEHIVTRVTDEGLVVELFETETGRLFDGNEPTALLRELGRTIVRASAIVNNPVAIEGHTASYPLVLARDPSWDVAGARAEAFRRLLDEEGFAARRVMRTTSYADREPSRRNRMDVRNNRLEVIFLRNP